MRFIHPHLRASRLDFAELPGTRRSSTEGRLLVLRQDEVILPVPLHTLPCLRLIDYCVSGTRICELRRDNVTGE